jgi:hypothetical protein
MRRNIVEGAVRPDPNVELKLLELKINVILKEYEVLRNEAHLRIGFFIQIFYVYALAWGAVYGFIFANKHYDLFLLFPWLTLGMYMRILWDQKMASFIDDYVRNYLEAKVSALIGSPPATVAHQDISYWFGWFDYFPTTLKKFSPLYKHAIFIVFVLISIFPSLAFASYHVGAHFFNWPPHSELPTYLQFPLMVSSAFVFSVMAIWITGEIYIRKF